LSPLGFLAEAPVIEAEARDRIVKARQFAIEVTERYGVVFDDDNSKGARAGRSCAVFRTRIGRFQDIVSLESRTCDLLVVGFDNRNDGDLSTTLSAIFTCGRPTLLVPRRPGAVMSASGRPDTVIVAWDGSARAARALWEALPVLVTATEVHIVMVTDNGPVPDTGNEWDLRSYLQAHGITPRLFHIAQEGRSIGETLLNVANRVGADLIVMGAYGRSHVGELLLGGVSDHLVKHSHISLLVAH